MLAKPDKAVLQAMESLQKDPRFQTLVVWLDRSLQETRRENDDLDGNDLTKSQGCAQTLNGILGWIVKAADTLRRFVS